MAEQLKRLLTEKGYIFFKMTDTNQQFVVLENEQMKALAQKVRFSFWEKLDDTHTVVRFATSWATTQQDMDALAVIL
jgi:threonine aldolase